jgi:hypothetical protein
VFSFIIIIIIIISSSSSSSGGGGGTTELNYVAKYSKELFSGKLIFSFSVSLFSD